MPNPLYINIKYMWFGLFGGVRHVNYCWLFDAKRSIYIYIKYMKFSLVWFYGISTNVGYSIPNSICIYKLVLYQSLA